MLPKKLSDFISTTDPTTGVRFYKDKNTLDKQYASVTTIIGKFEDKSFLKQWRKNVGEEEAEKVMVQSSSLGTRVHKANELFFTNTDRYQEYLSGIETEIYTRHKCYIPILEQVTILGHSNTPLLEQKLICEVKVDEEMYGFGGTPDLVGAMDLNRVNNLFYKTHHLKALISEDYFPKDLPHISFVADYKNWRGKSKSSADLLKTCLQLSAYMVLVNQFVEEPYKIRHGFIFGSNSENKLLIYHLDFPKMCWYAHWFLNFTKAFYTGQNLSWHSFKAFSLDGEKSYKPTRLYIGTGSNAE
jgi:hypothetical protein